MEAATAFLDSAAARLDLDFTPSVLLPGDHVPTVAQKGRDVVLGKGLRAVVGGQGGAEEVRCSAAGILRYLPSHSSSFPSSSCYAMEVHQTQYLPRVNDQIIGIVEDRGGSDFFKVQIFSGSSALLGRLSFDGASKRSRPELRRGDLVYCRVLSADKGLDTRTNTYSAYSTYSIVYGV